MLGMASAAYPPLAPKKALGAPLVIGADGVSMSLAKLGGDKAVYSEAGLQKLAFDHPEVLPVATLEPAFGAIHAVALEVPCGHGIIDNLYITAAGDIVLVEAKLWRNPQARREVVAQALDYVAALSTMGYEAFENACRKGQGMAAATLYDLVADQPDALDEQAFVDAVSRNLARGRMLVIALGDGIRSEAEALAELLQSHAGAHFTFALVELAIWQHPATGELLALPSTLAQTVMITRGIVTIENGMPVIKPVPQASQTGPSTITGELFLEQLAKTDPQMPHLLTAFLKTIEPLGVYADQRKTLILRAELPERSINLGYINAKGQLWTDAAGAMPSLPYLAYLGSLAQMIGGTVSHGTYPSLLNAKGAKPMLNDLLPAHANAWADAIQALLLAEKQSSQD